MNLFNFSNFDMIIFISFVFIFIMLLIANYYDIKYNIIPNNIVYLLLLYGLILNISLAILFNNIYFLIFSVLFFISAFFISDILWRFGFWGGGDVKIFSAIAFILSFLSRDFLLNQLPSNLNLIRFYLSSKLLNDMIIFSQFSIYPKIFSILFNGLLVSLPVVLMILFIRIFKDDKLDLKKHIKEHNKLKLYLKYMVLFFDLILFNTLSIIKLSSFKSVKIHDLKEGMILDKYYFSNIEVFNQIRRYDTDNVGLNLTVHDLGEEFYFKSANAGGLSHEDLVFINDLYDENLIKSQDFNIKLTIPFLPSLTIGLFIFLCFGDLIHIISHLFISKVII